MIDYTHSQAVASENFRLRVQVSGHVGSIPDNAAARADRVRARRFDVQNGAGLIRVIHGKNQKSDCNFQDHGEGDGNFPMFTERAQGFPPERPVVHINVVANVRVGNRELIAGQKVAGTRLRNSFHHVVS